MFCVLTVCKVLPYQHYGGKMCCSGKRAHTVGKECTVGTTKLTLTGSLKSKTHKLNTFFYFCCHFLWLLLQSLKTVLVLYNQKQFFWTNQNRYQKTQTFMLISNTLKKFLKTSPKKVISQTILMNMSKKIEKVNISATK